MKAKRYLSRPQVAERIGVRRESLTRTALPEPDAWIGELPGWLPITIDRWDANRPRRTRGTDG